MGELDESFDWFVRSLWADGATPMELARQVDARARAEGRREGIEAAALICEGAGVDSYLVEVIRECQTFLALADDARQGADHVNKED
jgi:hypothetical protein